MCIGKTPLIVYRLHDYNWYNFAFYVCSLQCHTDRNIYITLFKVEKFDEEVVGLWTAY